MYSIQKQTDLKKAQLQSDIEKLQRQLMKIQSSKTQTRPPLKVQPETIRTQSQTLYNSTKRSINNKTISTPTLSDKWKQSFKIKPRLIELEDKTYYDRSDYKFDMKLQYDSKVLDAFLMDKILKS